MNVRLMHLDSADRAAEIRTPEPGSSATSEPPNGAISGAVGVGAGADPGAAAAKLEEFSRIGVNLNQMARVLNSGAVPAAAGGGRRCSDP